MNIDWKAVWAEIIHYLGQYQQDGDCKIFEVKKTLVGTWPRKLAHGA